MLSKLLVTGLLTVLSGAGLALAQGGPATAASATSSQTSSVAPSTYEGHVQRWINVARSKRGLRALRSNSCAEGTSKRWSHRLATRDLFYHQSMTSVLNQCDALYAGETLGRGSISPRTLVRMWMGSPAHRRIMLSSQPRRIGIGAEQDQAGQWVVTANFIRR